MAYGLSSVVIVRKSHAILSFDGFKLVKILETVRQQFGYDFFHSGQLVLALTAEGLTANTTNIQPYLHLLVSFRYLQKQRLPFMWKTKLSSRPHYALSKKSKVYLEKWMTFTNPESPLYKEKLNLLEKVKNGSAAVT